MARSDTVVCIFNNGSVLFRTRGVALKESDVKGSCDIVDPSFIGSRSVAASTIVHQN